MLLLLLAPLLAIGSAAPVPIGAAVPDFKATDLGGHELVLAQELASHKAVVVMFLSTTCPYVRFFAEYIRDLLARYDGQGVLFVGVDSNQFETADEARAMAQGRGYTFPFIRDEQAQIADALGARRTPEAFLIDAASRLRYRGWIKSRIGSNDMEQAIDAVLAGRPVRKAETSAFGCAIDRPKAR